jgi:NAD(P)-dependent dehydrogenase (short-subunit alcohol dehydrogenase family)
MIDLHEKTALITGSTDGVGRVAARRLGEAGARILVHGRDSKRGNDVVAEIRGAGGRGDFLMADVSSLAQVNDLAQTVRHTASRLDILVNNVGVFA